MRFSDLSSLDRLVLLGEEDHPVGVLPGGTRGGVGVVVVDALGPGDERTAILPGPSRSAFEERTAVLAGEQVPGLVDHDRLRPRAGTVIHALGGEEDHQHQHDGLDVAAPFELGELEDGERRVELRRLRAREEAPHGAARAPGTEGGGHVGGAAVGAGFEVLADGAEIGVVACLVPGRRDGLGDQRGLDVVNPAPAPRHAADHARQHGEAFLAVIAVTLGRPGVDHGERVQTRRVLAEGDERALQGFGRVLERPSVVDHHGFAAGADQSGHQLLHQHRLA